MAVRRWTSAGPINDMFPWHRRRLRRTVASTVLCVVAALVTASPLSASGALQGASADSALRRGADRRKPKPPPSRWIPLIGEYGASGDTVIVLERDGRLVALKDGRAREVTERTFVRDSAGRVVFMVGARAFPRRAVGTDEGATFRVTPLKPIEELRAAALVASPPAEAAPRHASDLAELVAIDSSLRLDIRYAGTNNFLGAPMYSSARAFLQRPAAEALVRAHRGLAAHGYGLLIHDAYRPWYVTRMFWDATSGADHEFVADPAMGSRHNRGAAVDLTMFELATGKPVRMTGGYDEFSHRSYANYPGGTSLERWRRDLLRRAMESQGFTVNPSEWWHFDFNGWRDYPIQNAAFEQVARRK